VKLHRTVLVVGVGVVGVGVVGVGVVVLGVGADVSSVPAYNFNLLSIADLLLELRVRRRGSLHPK